MGATRSRYALTRPITTQAKAVGCLSSACDREIESLRELNGRLGMGESVRAGLRDDDHVDRWRDVRPTMPEHLAQKPFDPVPHD
jgi:hypothetical protein